VTYVLAALVAASFLGLVALWRAIRRIEPASSGSLVLLAESLVWCDGDLSPNGRRVLLVEPAARSFRSSTKTPEGAAWFHAGCPIDEDALRGRLPDEPVKEKVSWPLTAAEIDRLRAGFVPEALEDKWRIVTLAGPEGERVYLLRSWTGALCYVCDLAPHGVRWVWRGAGDPLGVDIARAVVDGYVLDKPCIIPAPRELGEDKLRLMTWGLQMAGRRCKGVEPFAGS
jgi:hypothetical protein